MDRLDAIDVAVITLLVVPAILYIFIIATMLIFGEDGFFKTCKILNVLVKIIGIIILIPVLILKELMKKEW